MPETTTKFVGFVDILGFSQLIINYDNGKDDKIFEKLYEAVHPAAKFIRESLPLAKGSSFYHWKECFDVRLFSDCLCVAAPLEHRSYGFMEQLDFFYKYLMGYQALLFEAGFFTRGAVTIGSHYADDTMIFSGGLVEAYNLETKKANYPRIILSDNLLAEIDKRKEGYATKLNFMLMKDNEGIVFFNHFNYNLMDAALSDSTAAKIMEQIGISGVMLNSFEEEDRKHKSDSLKTIRARCEESMKEQDERIKDKYQWLLDFIDFELGFENRRGFKAFNEW